MKDFRDNDGNNPTKRVNLDTNTLLGNCNGLFSVSASGFAAFGITHPDEEILSSNGNDFLFPGDTIFHTTIFLQNVYRLKGEPS